MAAITQTPPARSSSRLRMMLYGAAFCWAAPEVTAGPVLPVATYSSFESGIASTDLGGTPSPFADASATGGFFESSASASVTYSFEVVAPSGPTTGTTVPIQIATFVKNQVTGPLTIEYLPAAFYEAIASVDLGGPLNSVLAEFEFTGPLSASSSVVSDVNVLTGTVYQISVNAQADVDYMDASALAFADPSITVPEGYTLELSPGIGNGSPGTGPPSAAAPEPASLTLLGTGAAGLLLGYAWRRRKLAMA